jgi:hypothetical protein
MLVFWPYSVFGQNHLCVNDVANRDSTFQSEVRRISKFPVIPSGRPSVYYSIRPDDVSLRSDIRQTSITCPDEVLLPFGHLHRIEKLLCKLAPSGRFSSTSGRLSVLERITDSFQSFKIGKINQPSGRVSP